MSTVVLQRDPRIVSLPSDEIRRRFIDFFARRGHTVVPSASLVPAGDPTLLFTNSGMVQFKDVLTGVETRSYRRAVDYQRCLRVAGKHNDFEEVGRTPRHHTFFEMLGNWSFGDYFKREAIHFAWEFLTEDLKIPADRLAATVYSADEVSERVWREEIGLPAERLARWGNIAAGDEKNFWRMADVGPCGPCSEIHFDRGAEFSEGPHCIPDHSEVCPRWLEIWNLVFMEFNQLPDGQLVPLPFQSVDTGMGLERLASVLQQVPSNYDTDLFVPIHERMRELLGHDPEAFEEERFSYQVIADHSRAITFLVADGVMPSNEGRGYVLRRILRRAVRHGRLLGRREPFLAETARVVIDIMSGAYPYLLERQGDVLAVIEREETQFARTLDAGTEQLELALAALGASQRQVGRRPETLPPDAPVLPGEVAFRLHDTYGFPIDLTIELAAEYGVAVDRAGFDVALEAQRERSRRGRKAELARHAELTGRYEEILRRSGPVEFVGYELARSPARVVAILRDGIEYAELEARGDVELRQGAAAEAQIILDRTPFYPEGGGQVGDQGVLRLAPDGEVVFTVRDTQRPLPGLIVHHGVLHRGIAVGATVVAEIDAPRRERTMRNHTATHLLHRALRNVVGEGARQAGSLVHPDYLRFDFPLDRPLTVEERRAVEAEVQRIIRDDRPVRVEFLPLQEALARGADAFFDERYGETVRTVAVEGYSLELCGGTHCQRTGEIGSFYITGERSIGAGMRRIEAVTGEGADAWVETRLAILDELVRRLGVTGPEALPDRVAALQGEIRELRRRLKGGSVPIPRPAELAGQARRVGAGIALVTAAAPFPSIEEAKGLAKDVRGILGSGVVALAVDAPESELVVLVTPDLAARGVSAGDLVRRAVAVAGGKGGGRDEMAQARGLDGGRLAEVWEAMAEALRAVDGPPPG
jgi:alanyl-tRNA synthetase